MEATRWQIEWQRIRENCPHTELLSGCGGDDHINDMSDVNWEELGRDISKNTRLLTVHYHAGALNDHKMSYFFRGLTGSNSMEEVLLPGNGISAVGVRSMVPFLHNSSNLMYLYLQDNNIQSEGFNMLLSALSDSPIKELSCERCGIESIEIDSDCYPKHLKELYLEDNKINADGCRGLAKLLRGGGTVLSYLFLYNNEIDDDGVAVLVDALQTNTSLETINLERNKKISKQGRIMLLKLVNDVSSIEATLQSKHNLTFIGVAFLPGEATIYRLLRAATLMNRDKSDSEAAGKEKVIQTQLHSVTRAKLAELQDINHCLYSEINPLHLPEVFSLVGHHHDQGELYVALKSSIAGVISTVNRKQCLEQQWRYHNSIVAEHKAEMEAIEAEIASINAAEGHVVDVGSESESRSNKRRRTWWQGLWGGA